MNWRPTKKREQTISKRAPAKLETRATNEKRKLKSLWKLKSEKVQIISAFLVFKSCKVSKTKKRCSNLNLLRKPVSSKASWCKVLPLHSKNSGTNSFALESVFQRITFFIVDYSTAPVASLLKNALSFVKKLDTLTYSYILFSTSTVCSSLNRLS